VTGETRHGARRINQRVFSVALSCLLVAVCFQAEAQQLGRVYRIGYISGRSGAGPLDEVFKIALRDLGYIEGQNISITYRWAEERLDRLPALAVELAQHKVDVIVTETTPAAQAAKKATTVIPIVMVLSGDAVGAGLIASLASPGGNITGLTFIGTDVVGKLVELLRKYHPKSLVWRIWHIQRWLPKRFPSKRCRVARELGMTLKLAEARNQPKSSVHLAKRSRHVWMAWS